MQFLRLWVWPLYFQNLVIKLFICLETKPFGEVSYTAQVTNMLRKG